MKIFEEERFKEKLIHYFMAIISNSESNSPMVEVIVRKVLTSNSFTLDQHLFIDFLENVTCSHFLLGFTEEMIEEVVSVVIDFCSNGCLFVQRAYGLLYNILRLIQSCNNVNETKGIWKFILDIILHSLKLVLSNLDNFSFQE